MRILAVDDQQLTLTAIEFKLRSVGHEVFFGKNGQEAIEKLTSVKPDLVILDLNMPGLNGLEVIKEIRQGIKSSVPIMVMSGEDDEEMIVQSFKLGADEYIKKPVGLDELVIRVHKLLNLSFDEIGCPQLPVTGTIQKSIVGVIIPCYNEEKRLKTEAFKDFVKTNLGYHLCFVNDGSTDGTLEVLQELAEGREDYISIYNCPKNGGKAEAVRQGTLHLLQDNQLDYIGYLDADLSTNFEDFEELVATISESNFKIVGGSRIARMGANITKQGARAIISKTINLIIRKILGMTFQDTQCGAKVMTTDVAARLFKKSFLTSWLFDVELFMRMKKIYGDDKAEKLICEQPLKRWIHEDGSKLSMKDSIKIVGQLAQIFFAYRTKKETTQPQLANPLKV